MNWLQWFTLVCLSVAIVFFGLTIKELIKTARLNRDTERILREMAERRRQWAEQDRWLEERYPRRRT